VLYLKWGAVFPLCDLAPHFTSLLLLFLFHLWARKVGWTGNSPFNCIRYKSLWRLVGAFNSPYGFRSSDASILVLNSAGCVILVGLLELFFLASCLVMTSVCCI
jgi:hypothetical protein